MTLKARSNLSVTLEVGAVWVIEVTAFDDGVASSDTVTVTVTDPNGAVEEYVSSEAAYLTRTEVELTVPGRWVAEAAGIEAGAVSFTAYADRIVTAADMPSVTDLSDYLGTHSATDEQLADVLDAEASAQRDVCRIPAAYTKSLRQAVLRRCARNLAMRRIPLAMFAGDADSGAGPQIIPGRDPEVRRFEGPYRKLKTG